jgi:hypothetical protein
MLHVIMSWWMVGNRLVGRFCDREPMGIIFRDIVMRLVGCLKFGLSKLVWLNVSFSHTITSTKSPFHNHSFNLRFGLMFMFVQNML